MTFGEALFSFQGRISRSDYYQKGYLILLPFGIFSNLLIYGDGSKEARAIGMVIAVICIWPAMALATKRLHDRNRSAWLLATTLIPYLNIIFIIWISIEIMFLRGTVGPNRFGDDPVQTSAEQIFQQPLASEAMLEPDMRSKQLPADPSPPESAAPSS